MAIYVLVHGSWHGAWCWDKLVPYLEQAGHQTIRWDLPGHGADLTPILGINLMHYVDRISQCVLSCHGPVIVVGHSMAGMIISQVAEIFPDKIQALVYLAAFVPLNGESLFDVAAQQKPTRFVKQVRLAPEQNLYDFPLSFMHDFAYGDCSIEEFAPIRDKFTQEPLQPLQDPVFLSPHNFGRVPKFYIQCLQDKALLAVTQHDLASRAGCHILTLNSDHSPFYSHSLELSNLLLSINV